MIDLMSGVEKLKIVKFIALILFVSMCSCSTSNATIVGSSAHHVADDEFVIKDLSEVIYLVEAKKYEEAYFLLEKHKKLGNKKAELLLAKFYSEGWYVNKDLRKAYLLYKSSAESGDGMAMNELGGILYHGIGVPEDYKKGVQWYEKSVFSGNHLAAYNLANISVNHNDYKNAYKWIFLYGLLAKRNGNENYTSDPEYQSLYYKISSHIDSKETSEALLDAGKIFAQIN